MMARLRPLICSAAMLCVGCSVGSEGEFVSGTAGSPQWVYSAAPETQRAHFQKVCQGYGFAVGTPEMTQCLVEETRLAQGRAAAYSQAYMAGGAYNGYWAQTLR